MAEKLCELRKKGGGGGRYTETSLWTNSAPTSNFAAQTVTLSDSIDNYKYIAIEYKYAPDTSDSFTSIYSVNDLKKSVKDGNTVHDVCTLGIQAANNNYYARVVSYVSSTSIAFSKYSQLGGTGTGANNAIPLEILGLNELKYKPDDYIVTSGTFTISANSTETINLGFKPKKVVLKVYASSSWYLCNVYDEEISTTSYFRVYNYNGNYGCHPTRSLPDTNNTGLK